MAKDLLEVRNFFLEFSGRFDLGIIDNGDYGANKYINSGQRLLDELSGFQNGYNRHFDSVAAGTYYVALSNCRVIEEVWCNDSEERWRLNKADFSVLVTTYPDLVSEIDQADPYIWTPARPRTTGDDKTTLGTFLDYTADNIKDARGILFAPPNDEAMLIEVYGKFWTPELDADDEQTFWTQRSMLLAWAACYQLEVGYRNTEGSKDWMAAIQRELRELEKDVVEEESVNQLNG